MSKPVAVKVIPANVTPAAQPQNAAQPAPATPATPVAVVAVAEQPIAVVPDAKAVDAAKAPAPANDAKPKKGKATSEELAADLEPKLYVHDAHDMLALFRSYAAALGYRPDQVAAILTAIVKKYASHLDDLATTFPPIAKD